MRGTLILSILFLIGAWPAAAQHGDEPVRATDLLNIRQIDDVRVSPDGRQVVYAVRSIVSNTEQVDSLSYRTHLYVADAAGSSPPQQLTRGERSASEPAWSPGADRLAFVREVGGTPQVFVLPMSGGEAYQATDLEHGASSPRWSPDGSRLLVASTIPHEALRERLGAEPHWPSERPGRSHDATSDDDAAAPDGSLAEIRAWLDRNARDGNPRVFTRLDLQGEHDLEPAPSYRHLFVVDVDTATRPSMITQGYADFSGAAWLPDGERLIAAGRVYGVEHPDRTRGRRLYELRADGRNPAPLLDLPGLALDHPTVSPGGQLVAFTASDTSDVGYAQTELGVFDIDHPEGARMLTNSLDRSISAPAWSPDGWFLYFTASSDGGIPLYRTHPFELPPADTTDSGTTDDEGEEGDAPEEETPPANPPATDAVEVDTTNGEDDRADDATGPGAAEDPVSRDIEIERLSSFERGVRSFDVGPATVFFAATEATNPYELYAASLSLDNERRLTNHNADWIVEKRLSIPERHVLTLDSLQVEYWVMKPAFFDEAQEYPLLLQIHGGPMAMWGPGEASMWHEFQFFASRGYGIVFANPRGSGGYGYDFKRGSYQNWGSGPAGDVLAVADEADDLPWADSTRQVVTGSSYGGYLTTWITAHDDRFRAAVSQRGVYDLGTFLGEGNAWRLVPSHFGGFPWETADTSSNTMPAPADVLAHNSPLTYVQRIQTPLLIIHAGNDLRTGVSQSEVLYRSLKILGRPVEYVRYPDAGHDLSRTGGPRQRIDRLLRIYEFFERFVR